jgi:hypothetical protein
MDNLIPRSPKKLRHFFIILSEIIFVGRQTASYGLHTVSTYCFHSFFSALQFVCVYSILHHFTRVCPSYTFVHTYFTF